MTKSKVHHWNSMCNKLRKVFELKRLPEKIEEACYEHLSTIFQLCEQEAGTKPDSIRRNVGCNLATTSEVVEKELPDIIECLERFCTNDKYKRDDLIAGVNSVLENMEKT